MPAHDVTVTGTFNINKYKATYIIDGEVFKTDEVEYSAEVVPPTAPERAGYDFQWIDVPATMPAHDITIYGSYTTSIDSILLYDNDGVYFTPDGQKLTSPRIGVNIVKMSDGTVKKVVVK